MGGGGNSISGSLYNFEIYQDKANKTPTTAKTSDLGINSSVIVELSLALLNGHNFKEHADNFFASLRLIMDLKKRNIF